MEHGIVESWNRELVDRTGAYNTYMYTGVCVCVT